MGLRRYQRKTPPNRRLRRYRQRPSPWSTSWATRRNPRYLYNPEEETPVVGPGAVEQKITHLTPELAEVIRLVPQDSPEGQYFQGFMETLIKQLLPQLNLGRWPIHFIVCDDPTVNAFCIPSFKPPVISFNKGLLTQIKYVEELAGILGHEFTHKWFASKYGLDHKNTKLEELSADLWPLVLLYDAGLDPRQYVSHANAKIFKTNRLEWMQIFDVHPLHETRYRSLEDGLAVLDKARGGFADRSPTPLPPEFIEAVNNATHTSYVDHHLLASGYKATVNIFEKLNIAGRLLKTIWSQDREVNVRRIVDLNIFLRGLRIQARDPDQVQALDELAEIYFDDFIIDDPKWAATYIAHEEDVYQELSQMAYSKTHPLGRLRDYQRCINSFIDARSRDDALAAASICLNATTQDPLFQKRSRLVAIIDPFENFEPPYSAEEPVSWDKHIQWRGGSQEQLAQMLLALGIADERVFESCSAKLEQQYEAGDFIMFAPSLFIEGLVLHEEGEDEDDDDDEEEEEIDLAGLSLPEVEIDDGGYVIGEKTPIRKIYSHNYLLEKLSTREIISRVEDSLDQDKALDEDDDDFAEVEEQFYKEVKVVEAMFLAAAPGDKEAKKKLLSYAGRHIGVSSRKIRSNNVDRLWVALKHAEHNFELFLELNQVTMRELADDLSSHGQNPGGYEWGREIAEEFDPFVYITRFVDKLYEMAFLGPEVTAKVRHFFLGTGPASLSGNFIGGFLFPIFEHPTQYLTLCIIDNPNNIFTREEQLSLVSRHSSNDRTQDLLVGAAPEAEEPGYKLKRRLDYNAMNHLRQFLGYTKPTTGQAYLKLQQKLGKKYSIKRDMGIVELRLLINGCMTKKKSSCPFSPSQFDTFLLRMDPATIKPYEDLQDFFRVLVGKKKWPTDLEILLDQWLNAYNADIFPQDLKLCYSLLRRILREIKQLKDIQAQQRLYERFLFNYRLADPHVRDRIHHFWVNTIYKQHGIDVGDASYSASIEQILKQMSQGIRFVGDLVEVAALLANQLQTQTPLTKKFYKVITGLSKANLHKTQFQGMLIETAMSTLRFKPRARQAFIVYLLHPLTSRTVDNLYEVCREETDEMVEIAQDVGTEHARTIKIPPDRAKAELSYLWQNFWAMPFIARAAFFEYLLFPEVDPNPEARQEIFDYVNDHLFPQDEPYSKESREFVRAYFKVTPPYQHRILLSAMMVTAERSQSNQLSIGERLAAVLELLGPAETKLGQVIHSHPQTPDEVRDGMGRLKSQADPPYRWDLMKNYIDCVPVVQRRDVSRVGRLLGSASFFLAFEAQMKMGQRKIKGVFKILRPYALERARNGFTIMLEMLQFLELGDNVIQVLEQMIGQARNNAEIETDHQIGIRQTQMAVGIYDGRNIELDGEDFVLHVPKVLQHGDRYQFVELAPGKHFNDLPEKKPEQVNYKKKIAVVYFGFELATIMGGGRFDSDRHGAQMRVKGNDIYLFDWGNMLLEPPSDKQLAQLGQLLVDTFMSILGGVAIDSAMTSALETRMDSGEDVDYLLEVQKALLSLQDFRRMISQEELMYLLGSALQNAHPAIMSGIMGRAMELEIDYSALQQFLDSPSPLELRIRRFRRRLR